MYFAEWSGTGLQHESHCDECAHEHVVRNDGPTIFKHEASLTIATYGPLLRTRSFWPAINGGK